MFNRRHFLKTTALSGMAIAAGVSTFTTPKTHAQNAAPGMRHPIRLGAPYYLPQDDLEKLVHGYRAMGLSGRVLPERLAQRRAACPRRRTDFQRERHDDRRGRPLVAT